MKFSLKSAYKYLLLTAYVSVVSASDGNSPFSKSVKELIDESTQRSDGHYMAVASMRCGVLLAKMSGIVSRDAPSASTAEYDLNSDNLAAYAVFLNQDIARSRGRNDSEMNEVQENTMAQVTPLASLYNDWFEKNFIEQGEYFGSSPALIEELTICRQLGREISRLFVSE